MKKRIISIITVLTLMLSCISVSASPKLTDIENVSGKNEIELLYNLGIVEGNDEGEFMPEASVKRIEFAVMILRMLKMDEFAMEGEFADIPSTHWAYNYAGTLKSMGIVEGIGDNKFGIDMDVTYEQALKMLVSALGYSNIAEQQGGFPNGYVAMATTLGITDDVPMSTGAVNRLSAALLIENCLEADMLKPGQEDTKNPDNILEDTLRYTKMRGTVDATFDAYGSENLKYNEIVISGVRYKLDVDNCIIDTTGLFGREVEYYVTERDYEKVISHIRPVGQKIESITADADDIASNTTKTQFNYYKNEKLESETIETPTNVYYNGRQVPTAKVTNALLKPSDGYVTIIDLDNNGSFETVQIKEYKTKLVTRATDTMIYASYGGNLDLEKYEHVEIYYKGNEVSISDIEPGDVLSVSTDMNGENASIIISRTAVDGKITRTRTNSRGVQICNIENGSTVAEHSIDKAYTSAADSNAYGIQKIDIGTEGRFYFSEYGKIANYEKVTIADDGEEVTGELYPRKNDMLYGYLWSSQLAFDGEDMLVMKVLTEENKYENIVVNGEARFGRRVAVSYSYQKEKAAKIYEVVGGTKQMIAYKLGDDGYVEGLCLADTVQNDDFFCLSVPEGDALQFSNKMFGKKYYVDQDTVVFSTPHSSTYYAYNIAGSYNDVFTSGSYQVMLYDVEDDGRIGAIHYDDDTVTQYTNTNEIYIDPGNSPIMFVTDVSTGLYDGEEVTYVTGIEDGMEVKRIISKSMLSKSEDPSLIETGMVIQYETNAIKLTRAQNADLREELVLYKKVMNLNDNNSYKTTFGYEGSIIGRISGTTALSDRSLIVSYANIKGITPNAINIKSNRDITLMKNMNTLVMHYDRSSQTFSKKTLNDLQAGMDVFVRQRNNNTIEIVYFD